MERHCRLDWFNSTQRQKLIWFYPHWLATNASTGGMSGIFQHFACQRNANFNPDVWNNNSAFPFSASSGNRPSKDGSIQFSFKCDSDEVSSSDASFCPCSHLTMSFPAIDYRRASSSVFGGKVRIAQVHQHSWALLFETCTSIPLPLQ